MVINFRLNKELEKAKRVERVVKSVDNTELTTHAARTTGTHGVGGDYVAIASGSQYTAVNKAGDTMTGALIIGNLDGANSQLKISQNADPNTNYIGLRRDNVGDFRIYNTALSADVFVLSDNRIGIGAGASTPNAKAILDLTSTTLGFLPPRMTTTQRDAITTPPAGLMVYNLTTNKLNFYNGSAWEAVTSA